MAIHVGAVGRSMPVTRAVKMPALAVPTPDAQKFWMESPRHGGQAGDTVAPYSGQRFKPDYQGRFVTLGP